MAHRNRWFTVLKNGGAFHGYGKQPEGRFPFFLADHVGKAMP
jgi:hypothetical protein